MLAIEDKESSLEKSKDEKNVKTVLHAKIESNTWIIDSRCSNHMTCDKDTFINLRKYDGGFLKFVGKDDVAIQGIGSISIDRKHNIDDVYYVEELRNSLLSVSQMCREGY